MTYDATTLDAGATAIGGLTTATTYYAIRVDDNNIKVASSASNANNGTALTLSSTGSGSMFFQGQQAVIGTITVAGGAVIAVAVTTKGTGYSSAPVITIADSGTGAGASVQGLSLIHISEPTRP